MADFVAFTVLGLALGGAYAIAASGMVLTYTTTGVFNFAHGAVAMLSAFVYWQLRWDDGWGGRLPAPLALVVVVAVLAPAAGIAIDRLVMRNLRGAPETARIAVPIGLLLALTGLANWVWSNPEPRDPQPFFGSTAAVQIGKVGIEVHRLVILGSAVAVAVALRFLLSGTRLGVRMRAVVDNPELVQLNGANPDLVSRAAWALGFAAAALSGVLLSPLLGSLSSLPLTLLVINAYAAAAFGRLRSLPWTFAGAVAIGLVVNYWAWIKAEFGNDWIWLANFRSTIPILMLFAILVAMPSRRIATGAGMAGAGGLLGGAGRRAPAPSALRCAGWGLALVGAVLALAHLLAPNWQLIFGESLALAVVGLSVVLLTGHAGEISLAPLTFAGIGALVAFQIDVGPGGRPSTLDGSLWAYVVAAAVCALVGAVIALPALRLRGLYLALATFAFAVAVSYMVFSQISTLHLNLPLVGDGADVALDLFTNGVLRVPRPGLPGVGLDRAGDGDQIAWLVFLALAFAVLGGMVAAVRRSAYGQRLAAMRDSPAAAAMLGLNAVRLKMSVFALSSAIAGIGGVLLVASSSGGVNADDFTVFASLALVLLVAVMGVGRVSGALMGGLMIGAGFPMIRDVLGAAGERASAFEGLFDFGSDLAIFLGPAIAGMSLGAKPAGNADDIFDAYRPLGLPRGRPVLAAGMAVTAVAYVGAVSGRIGNWLFALVLLAVLVALPAAAARRTGFRARRTGAAAASRRTGAAGGSATVKGSGEDRAGGSDGGEWSDEDEGSTAVEVSDEDAPPELWGVDRPFTAADRRRLDRELGIAAETEAIR